MHLSLMSVMISCAALYILGNTRAESLDKRVKSVHRSPVLRWGIGIGRGSQVKVMARY